MIKQRFVLIPVLSLAQLRLSALNKGQTAFVAFTCYEEFFDSITIPGQRFDITLNAKVRRCPRVCTKAGL